MVYEEWIFKHFEISESHFAGLEGLLGMIFIFIIHFIGLIVGILTT